MFGFIKLTFRFILNLVREYLNELGSLFYPLSCPNCNEFDVLICPNCFQELDLSCQVFEVETELLGVNGKVFSAGIYKGALRSTVLSWKDHGRADLASLIDSLIKRVVNKVFENRTDLTEPIAIVPAPSSKESQKAREFLQTLQLANAVKEELESLGKPAVVRNVLVQKKAKKQVENSSINRALNKKDAIILKRVSPRTTL